MTTKRSMFGSLEQRLQQQSAGVADRTDIRHVWLDTTTPALVTDRRRRFGAWEGLVLYIKHGQPALEWVTGDRISKLTGVAPKSGS